MSLVLSERDIEAKLKAIIHGEPDDKKLERLSAALIGKLLDVRIYVASSGFQFGADNGTAGERGRDLRIECKKYKDTTNLRPRDVLGAFDQARMYDGALEAWIFVVTRDVTQQIADSLKSASEESGVPVVILDWPEDQLGRVAALCAFNPDIVSEFFGSEAGALARDLQPFCGSAIEELRRSLEPWHIGFKSLREKSHAKLEDLWYKPKECNFILGQDAAAGAREKKIKRASASAAFDRWWKNPSAIDSPLAIVGWEGVGKTWAALDWLMDSLDDQPIILTVGSSTVAGLRAVSEVVVKDFLAERLYELTQTGDHRRWRLRLDRLLLRPSADGPALTLFLDGLNQEQSVPWISLLKALQAPVFEGRVRVMVSTRKHHFNEGLSQLKSLISKSTPVEVEKYDSRVGGELDQMLALEGLTRNKLQDDLLELARVPRLFELVVRFRDRVRGTGEVTIHRLLWEYGRDTLNVRAGHSFTEMEWRAWLRTIAQRYRDGHRSYTKKELGETTSRPDLNEDHIFNRLSDIIDGPFASSTATDQLELTAMMVSHALGAALLSVLDDIDPPAFDKLETELNHWLDPIGGLDQRAEILRAAVSIVLERDGGDRPPTGGVLVTAWLQTQNVSDQHRHELAGLATRIPGPLLDAVEHSPGSGHASARLWALDALRSLPKSDGNAAGIIVDRLETWFSTISRNLYSGRANADDLRRDRFIGRLGVDAEGELTVLGRNLLFVESKDDALYKEAAGILEGFPLAPASKALGAAALSAAVTGQHDVLDRLKWLCLFNEVDALDTAAMLRKVAADIGSRHPEEGVKKELPARVAALVLRLTGFEDDDERAEQIDPRIDYWVTYEADYLPNPATSRFFPLERRHVNEVLTDTTLDVFQRLRRAKEWLIDPSVEFPEEFVTAVLEETSKVDAQKLSASHFGTTSEKLDFEDLAPALARCAPECLAKIARDAIGHLGLHTAESRYSAAMGSTDAFVLSDDNDAVAANTLRHSAKNHDANEETFAATQMLMLELRNQTPRQQFKTVVEADLEFILTDLFYVLEQPGVEDTDDLVERFELGTPMQKRNLLILFSMFPTQLGGRTWHWIESVAFGGDSEDRGVAFKTLATADAVRFGKSLFDRDWSWNVAEANLWVNHYGSAALMTASLGVPFEQFAPRVAPWRLIEAARHRGEEPSDVRLAAEIFGHALETTGLEEPDPGTQIFVDRVKQQENPLSFEIGETASSGSAEDIKRGMQFLMDPKLRMDLRKKTRETAGACIAEARKLGAKLYLVEVAVEDMKSAQRHAPDRVASWLVGMDELSSDFSRRVRLAEGVYLSLCEALLSSDPDQGAALWRALRRTMSTRYVGLGGIDEMVHVAFRSPDSPAVFAIREEALDLAHSNTDLDLLNVVMAAQFQGKIDWLDHHISQEYNSAIPWRRKRAIALSGFISLPSQPTRGEPATTGNTPPLTGLEERTAHFRYLESCAHYWWSAFCAAEDAERAYAAWTLFTHAADRRAAVWMRKELASTRDDSDLFHRKIGQMELNRHELKRRMETRLGKVETEFLGRKTIKGIGPWNKPRQERIHEADSFPG